MFKLSEELIIFYIAATPFFGLHSAMPLALTFYKMYWLKAFFLSVSGNILPILPFLLILESLSKYLKKYDFFYKLFVWVQEYKKGKNNLAEIYEILGLMIFAAVPLPFTGIWFGGLIAFILGMKFKYAFFAMSLGSIISGIIILCVLKLGYLIAVITAVALIGTVAVVLYEILINNKNDSKVLGVTQRDIAKSIEVLNRNK